MDTATTDVGTQKEFTLGAAREEAHADGLAHAESRLKAALARELGSAETAGADAKATIVEAWARQLGLGGTALLTTEEVAPLLRICERSVRQGIKDGRIPHVRLGRRLLIPVPKLLAMLLEERDPHG